MKHTGPGSRRAAKSGSATVEFALSFLLLWAFMSGAFRVGYSIYVYQSLVSAVASAARYAAQQALEALVRSQIHRAQRQRGSFEPPKIVLNEVFIPIR